MASFAKITEENEVLTVLAFNDLDMLNADGVETESVGQAYLEQHNNWPAHLWIQTSYNTDANIHKLGGTPFRGNYPGTGYTWDSTNQIFWSTKPYPSWIKNFSTASWESPLGTEPDDLTEEEMQNRVHYEWNESEQSWDKTTPAE
tara:strand:+ start:199 stop:633 length:435 start_codon:yes stop_codon:yes gene_type:complete